MTEWKAGLKIIESTPTERVTIIDVLPPSVAVCLDQPRRPITPEERATILDVFERRALKLISAGLKIDARLEQEQANG